MAFFKKLKEKIFKPKTKDDVLDHIKDTRQEETIKKYEKAFTKSRDSFTRKIQKLVTKHREIDESYFNDLEEILIMADVGVTYTQKLIRILKEEVKIKNIKDTSKINELIFEKMFASYLDDEIKELNLSNDLNVILVIGVNGVGKTTSIGKLSYKLLEEGHKIVLAAADTFRAGAVAQLKEWADRVNVSIATPEKEGQDPTSVIYKGIQIAKEEKANILICDTAGRLENKVNLMNELKKIKKVIEREVEHEINETLLVIDATTGQSGVSQARAFHELTTISGIILTKMDSSAKGGIILAIKEMFDIPVKYIGLGESLQDLEKFDLSKYIYSLTKEMIDEKENR